jgi:hypothetical protein
MLAIPRRDWRLWQPSSPLRRLKDNVVWMADHLKYTGAHLTYKTVGGTSHLAYCGLPPCSNCNAGTIKSSYSTTLAGFADVGCDCSWLNGRTFVITQDLVDGCAFLYTGTTAGGCAAAINFRFNPTQIFCEISVVTGAFTSAFDYVLAKTTPYDCSGPFTLTFSTTVGGAVPCNLAIHPASVTFS